MKTASLETWSTGGSRLLENLFVVGGGGDGALRENFKGP